MIEDESGRAGAHAGARSRRRPVAARPAVVGVICLAVMAVATGAHEGHGVAVTPTYHEVQAGGALYRVGFAMQPQDALIGEDVRLDFWVTRVVDPANAASGEPVTGDLEVEVVSATARPLILAAAATDKPGAYLTRTRFDEAGQYGVAVRIPAGAETISTEFPIAVGAGPLPRTALVIDAIVLLVAGAWLVSRRRQARTTDTDASFGARDFAVAGLGAAALVVGHLVLSPVVGRMLLPERHSGAVQWTAGALAANAGTAGHDEGPGAPHTEQSGRGSSPLGAMPDDPGARSRPAPAHDIVSTVVPIPGQLVEVIVPMSARVLFDGFVPRIGAAVRQGQQLATLEHHYILHDSVHLINQRYLYMVQMLSTRRQRLQAELNLVRLRHLLETGDASVKSMMTVTQAVPNAALTLETAKLEEERATKLLEMHDTQIAAEELVRRPLHSPINGIIEAVNFTQGQLKYENDRLFTLLDLSRVWAEARFPEDMTGRPPQRLTFASAAFPTMRFEGQLARVAETIDPASGTLSAYYELANRDRLLRIGMPLVASPSAVLSTSLREPPSDVRLAVATQNGADDPSTSTALNAVVKASPELTAEVAAPLWGRIEFAGRRLAVGDRVKKGETLLNVVLELSIDERYPMNARGVDIHAELEQSKLRRTLVEDQRSQLIARMKATPNDPLVQAEGEIIERMLRAAEEEEDLFTRQAGAYQGTIKRRDPKTTPIQAPISGIITEVGFRPGELNGTDEFRRLLTIVDTSRVWLEAPVYESQTATLLRDFGRASFTAPGLSEARPLGRPLSVSGTVNPSTGALTAIFDVANPQGALKLGAAARIAVTRDAAAANGR